MLAVSPPRIILDKHGQGFEKHAVLNPAAIERNGLTNLFYRAVGEEGISSIGKAIVDGTGEVIARGVHPVLFPEHEYERSGTEDPRVVLIDGTYYLTYTAYDGQNASIAYATSDDLETFTKGGLLSPRLPYDSMRKHFFGLKSEEAYVRQVDRYQQGRGPDVLLWHKDGLLFPAKISGRFALMHRILPGIQIAFFDDFTQLDHTYWQREFEQLRRATVLEPKFQYESAYIGGGCPPIETEIGWLLVYHAVEETAKGLTYHAALALLDLNDPRKVIARLPYPLFSPSEAWELEGYVNRVVFPSGAILSEGRVSVYYGAADTLVAERRFDLREALVELGRYCVSA